MIGVKYTAKEAMAIYAARQLKDFDGKKAIIGIGMPVLAALIAKSLYSPNLKASIESGDFDVDIAELPFSLFASRVTYGCSAQLGNLMVLATPVSGKVELGFLGGAQIDKYGNINSTVIGDYLTSTDRLAGTGGAIDIGAYCENTITIIAHEKRRIVERVDYVTTPGWMAREWPGGKLVPREKLNLKGGPMAVITSMAILKFDPSTREMYVEKYLPGITIDQIIENTGYPIDVSRAVMAEDITDQELKVLREKVDPLNLYKTRN